MKTKLGLRHQLVTAGQRDVFDHWRELCERDGKLPTRSDIDPARIRRHLPFISLYEAEPNIDDFRVRLAGTGFWNFFQYEITGRSLNDLPLGEGRAYWRRVLSHVSSSGQPMSGTTRPHTPVGAHLHQFWLRLPLAADRRGDANLVLGFDAFLETPDSKPSRLMSPVFGKGIPMLATV